MGKVSAFCLWTLYEDNKKQKRADFFSHNSKLTFKPYEIEGTFITQSTFFFSKFVTQKVIYLYIYIYIYVYSYIYIYIKVCIHL